MRTLTAVYDLSLCPPTYDALIFALEAERVRRAEGCDAIDIMIVPGPIDGFRRDHLWPYGGDARRAMLRRVTVPLFGLLPSVRRVDVLGARPAQPPLAPTFGWNERRYGLALAVELARAGGYARLRAAPALVDQVRSVHGRDFVTITLREAEHWPSRNSDLAAWLAVARALVTAGREVVVIRDTLKANEPLPDRALAVSALAATDLPIRAAFYQAAALNLVVNNGPGWLPFALGAPVAMFKIEAANAVCSDAAFFAGCGLPRGSQWPNARADQRLVWADDREEIVWPVVEEMLGSGGELQNADTRRVGVAAARGGVI